MRWLEGSLLAALSACSSDAAPGPSHPPLTVTQACDARTTWSSSAECTYCASASLLAACACRPTDPYLGTCSAEQQAMTSSADCPASVDTCVHACAAGDCACALSCYAGHDACRALAEKRDACVVDVCAKPCKP